VRLVTTQAAKRPEEENRAIQPGARRQCRPHDGWGHRANEARAPGDDACRDRVLPRPLAGHQYSMIRVKYGVIPAVRTGLMVTFPTMLDASNI
jgi:hypothetical protein